MGKTVKTYTGERGKARAAGAAVAVAGVAALGAWALRDSPSPAAPPAVASASTGLSLMAAGGHSTAATADQAAPLREVERRLFVQGSLRGTEPDGGWSVDAQGKLQPSIALRRRFDYYLSTLGEAKLEEISALLLAHAARDLTPEAVAQVRQVWERYLALQQYGFQHQVNLNDRATWAAALAERRQVRRQVLGTAWAEAFYAEEEGELAHRLAEPSGTTQVATSALLPDPRRVDAATLHQQRIEQFGEAAALRLREEDALWAAWERRLLQAHAEVDRLRKAPELSDLQRDEAITQYLAANFNERERLRVRALMQLP
ncbi:lipase secretion chaperone [Aquabacterium sp. A7-Y]|uniref:lipase secretion chaperone n=1 Tax=Aquabacterium sp. A7-Y TaxID=1349605 RepID=UPI00223D56C2|nr:lipase secretion chaperone [Aquabacterium sp. A7-Y]MCW7538956.1 lipase secretion chaperone [Aquabacterium sp. A7-Y]